MIWSQWVGFSRGQVTSLNMLDGIKPSWRGSRWWSTTRGEVCGWWCDLWLMDVDGCLWMLMIYGCLWMCSRMLMIYGCLWMIYGCLWMFMDVYGKDMQRYPKFTGPKCNYEHYSIVTFVNTVNVNYHAYNQLGLYIYILYPYAHRHIYIYNIYIYIYICGIRMITFCTPISPPGSPPSTQATKWGNSLSCLARRAARPTIAAGVWSRWKNEGKMTEDGPSWYERVISLMYCIPVQSDMISKH